MKMQRPLLTFASAAMCSLIALPAAADIQFTDATADAGIDHAPTESYGASWGDLDGDGRPDLFVSNHRTKNSLYLNIGNGHFMDVTNQTFSFINKPNADTHAGIWFDADNNGTQDLYVATGIGNPDQFLVNERGALVNRTTEYQLGSSIWGGRLPVWMDYDGDGRPDFVMMSIEQTSILMQQLSGKKFATATTQAGLACQHQEYGHLLDVTGTGRLDLVCPDGPFFPQKVYNMQPTPWDASPASRFPANIPGGPDSVVADFNNDGRMDVFVLSGELRPSGAQLSSDGTRLEARLMGDNKEFSFKATSPVTVQLTSNVIEDRKAQIAAGTQQAGYELQWIRIGQNGAPPADSTFVLDPSNAAQANLPADNGSTPPTVDIGYVASEGRWHVKIHSRLENGESAWSDVNFLVSSSQPMTDLQLTGLWDTDLPSKPALLMNRPEGFVNEVDGSGLDIPMSCVSAAAGDFDNDGRIDLYLACRTATSNIENMLFQNQGNGKFVRVANAGGAAGPIGLAITDGAGTADSVVTADYDGDGFLDLYVTNGFNLFPKGVGGPNKLYRNQTNNGNHWIELDLVGVKSIREAIGTQVAATTGSGTQTRVKDGGYHRWSQDSTRMHFGLAQATTADLTIHWPSGTVETYQAVPANHIYKATENGGIAPVDPDAALPYPCGLPAEFNSLSGTDLNTALDKAVFIAKDCTSGTWQLRTTKGSGDAPSYTGKIVSSSPFQRIRTRNLQTADKVSCDGGTCVPDDPNVPDVTTAAVKQVDYSFQVLGGFRGVDITPVDGANTCVTVQAPAGTPILIGPLKKPVSTNQFYLETLEPCTNGVPVDPPPTAVDTGNGGDPPPSGSGNGSTSGGGGSGGGMLGVPFLFALVTLLVWRRALRVR